MCARLADLNIVIRGAGEMASGIACRLHRAGFTRLLMTEIAQPLTVRRSVSFSEAVHEKRWVVEGIEALLIDDPADATGAWEQRLVPVIVDPLNDSRIVVHPDVIVDGIMAKKNLGTTMAQAPLVIGLGPGFYAGKDAHIVVETNRGHDLGRLVLEGAAAHDTGVPGDIGGETVNRVIKSQNEGIFYSDLQIGSFVDRNEPVGRVDGETVLAHLRGVLRGLIRPGTPVSLGLKIGDVDPRGNPAYCHTVSDKARALGGAVLEAILLRFNT